MKRRNKASTGTIRHWLPLGVLCASAATVGLTASFLSVAWSVAVVGFLVSALLSLTVVNYLRTKNPSEASLLEAPFTLAGDSELFSRYQHLAESLVKISRQADPIFRGIALEQLDDLTRKANTIAGGTFVFEGTETWRIVYERLLRSPGLHLYRSVAWVKNQHYWQDEPGRKSMAVNFELHESERLNIERIVIIADTLWPAGEVWPAELVRQWLHQQHARGIWIKFVRQSVLEQEPELLADIGIYGSRALGIQELDEQCRTVRFTLIFEFGKVAEAEDRWNRLAVYAESFASYLDRYEMP